MAEMIGIKSQFVAEVTLADLNKAADELESSAAAYEEYFSALAEDVEAKYIALLSATLKDSQANG